MGICQLHCRQTFSRAYLHGTPISIHVGAKREAVVIISSWHTRIEYVVEMLRVAIMYKSRLLGRLTGRVLVP